MNIADKQMKNIAKKTLSMTPSGARIMGGMDYETAYQYIFRTNLRDRLNQLVDEYGDNPGWLSWELGKYGWDNPADLLKQL